MGFLTKDPTRIPHKDPTWIPRMSRIPLRIPHFGNPTPRSIILSVYSFHDGCESKQCHRSDILYHYLTFKCCFKSVSNPVNSVYAALTRCAVNTDPTDVSHRKKLLISFLNFWLSQSLNKWPFRVSWDLCEYFSCQLVVINKVKTLEKTWLGV